MGCDGGATGGGESAVQLTSTSVRAQRRAYDGAPPVIPHAPLGAACVTCHTPTGRPIPSLGMAPANPHSAELTGGALARCRQCHVFRSDESEFRASSFVGLSQDIKPGERMFAGAPPVIPHKVQMRENCLACHAGPAARPEIRCSHPERTRCVQCHVHPVAPGEAPWAAVEAQMLRDGTSPQVSSAARP